MSHSSLQESSVPTALLLVHGASTIVIPKRAPESWSPVPAVLCSGHFSDRGLLQVGSQLMVASAARGGHTRVHSAQQPGHMLVICAALVLV